MKRDTDVDSADNRIDDVDQIFESFVKKKLQQLGMKRAAAKAVNNGPMRELAGDVKMKLEQSLTNDESEYQPPVPMKVKKKDKKEKKSKKKKKEKKKKKDKETEKKTKKANAGEGKQGEKERKKIKKDRSDGKSKVASKADAQSTTPLKTDTVEYENAGKTSVPHVDKDATVQKDVPVVTSRTITREALTPRDTVSNLPQPEAKTDKGNSSPAAQPKKDIATIKMKVEMLRAKSAKEEIRKKPESLLQVQTPKDEKVVEQVESKQASTTRELKKRNSSSRSRSRSRSRKRSRRHSRHRSRSRSRSGSRTRRTRRHRSRSPHRRNHHRKRKSRSSERRTYKSKKSRRSHSPHISAEDKVRLLEIAKANALAQHKASSAGVSMSSVGQLIKAGSMSVTELTNMCKDIADGKEAKVADVPKTKTEAEQMIEEAAARVHHPFAVRDKPIIFNIKPSLAPPPPSASRPVAVLSKEFPVSCGQQHRRKEVLESVYGKWEVVAKDEATKNAVKELVASDKVFVEPEPVELDIGSVMAERATAAKQLQEDPNSEEAQGMMLSIQQRLNRWTQSKQIIGQFTGESGIQPMPKAQLESGRPAWFKQEDLRNAKHVGGIGKSLLQKMGWKPGMPLGKTMHGQLEPLSVNVKSDRRGLSSFMEAPPVPNIRKQKAGGLAAAMKDLSDKHPVSALMEVCSKRRWQPPSFSLVDPCNTKIFTFKVTVCNDEYTGKPASNKKQAKLKAAEVALQCMGLIPRPPNT